jgi:hypothetical protein
MFVLLYAHFASGIPNDPASLELIFPNSLTLSSLLAREIMPEQLKNVKPLYIPRSDALLN